MSDRIIKFQLSAMISKIVRALDIISPAPAFNVSGKDRIQSLSGGIFVIMSFATLLLYAIYAIWDFTRYQLVSSSEISRTILTSSKIDLKSNRLLPVIALLDTRSGEYLDPNLSYQYLQFYFELEIPNPDPTSKVKSFIPFTIKPCANLSDSSVEKYFDGVYFDDNETGDALSNSLCVTPKTEEGELIIQGIIHRRKTIAGKLYAYPCNSQFTECAERDKAETLSLLANLKVNIGFVNPVIDTNNFNKPISYELDYSRYYFMKDILTTEVDIMIGKTSISDDLGPLISKANWTHIFNIGSEKERSITRLNPLVSCDYQDPTVECQSYFRMTIYSGVTETEIIRKYKGLVEVLGTIGGNKEIILIVFAVLFKIFYGRQQKLRIVKYVYGLEPEKQKKGWCFKKKQTGDKYKTKLIPGTKKDLKGSSQKDSSANTSDSSIIVTESVIDTAFQSIENSLDVFALIKELNKMKLLFSYFMVNHRNPAWQVCYMNQHISEENSGINHQSDFLQSEPEEMSAHNSIPDEVGDKIDLKPKMPFSPVMLSKEYEENQGRKTFSNGGPIHTFTSIGANADDKYGSKSVRANDIIASPRPLNLENPDGIAIGERIKFSIGDHFASQMMRGPLYPWKFDELERIFTLDKRVAGRQAFMDEVKIRTGALTDNVD